MEFDRSHMKSGLDAIAIFSLLFIFMVRTDSSQSRLDIFQTKPKKSMYMLWYMFCIFFLKYLEN